MSSNHQSSDRLGRFSAILRRKSDKVKVNRHPFHYRQFAWPSLHGLTSVCGLAVAPSNLANGELFPFRAYKRKIPATVSVAGIFVLFNSALNRFDIKVEKCGG